MTPILGIIASGISGSKVVTNSYESIATVTVGSGGTSSVSFSSIASTWTHLQLRIMARSSSASSGGTYMTMRFNSDTGTNYSMHDVGGDGSSAFAEAYTTLDQIYVNRVVRDGTTASIYGVMIIDILDYANTNKYKTTRTLGGFDANGSGRIDLDSGNWRNTNAISTITLTATNGAENFLTNSHFALYGIKA